MNIIHRLSFQRQILFVYTITDEYFLPLLLCIRRFIQILRRDQVGNHPPDGGSSGITAAANANGAAEDRVHCRLPPGVAPRLILAFGKMAERDVYRLKSLRDLALAAGTV
jgi:hypothetical protein